MKLESVCDEKDEDVPGEMTLAKQTNKNISYQVNSEIFHDIESVKDKMLEADLTQEYDNLPRHRKDLLELYHKLDDKKASTVQTTLN